MSRSKVSSRRPRPFVLTLTLIGIALAAFVPTAQATITPSGALAIANAIASPSATVTGASFVTQPPSGTPNGVSTTTLTGFPTDGSSFGVLTSGNVSVVGSPATFANVADGGSPVRGTTDMDVSILKVDLSVPAAANCLTFDFRFLSFELGVVKPLQPRLCLHAVQRRLHRGARLVHLDDRRLQHHRAEQLRVRLEPQRREHQLDWPRGDERGERRGDGV
jgi:hypothetical protein